MKKIISLCLSCVLLAAVCAASASCAQMGLTLPSGISTQHTGATAYSTLWATTRPTTSATTSVATSNVPKPPLDISKIPEINYLDFRPEVNKWAEKDADGNYLYTSFDKDDYVDQDGNPGGDYFPFPLYYPISGINYEFKNNGEVIRLTATDTKNPGIAFELARMNTYPVGPQENGTIEYVKIRFKNNSPSTKLTFMGTNPFAGSNLDARASATIDIIPNSDEWYTITISMVEGSKSSANNFQTGENRWLNHLKKFAIYPFGYGKDNETVLDDKYYMEIDYVVIGSKEYVTSYQSELEKAEYNEYMKDHN